jgi:hypothetical protein
VTHVRQLQIVTHGLDAPLVAKLREFCDARQVRLRDIAQRSTLPELLLDAGRCLCVLGLGRQVEQELKLLDDTEMLCPDVVMVAASSVDNPALAALAWNLGAECVLFPVNAETLLEVVENFTRAETTP